MAWHVKMRRVGRTWQRGKRSDGGVTTLYTITRQRGERGGGGGIIGMGQLGVAGGSYLVAGIVGRGGGSLQHSPNIGSCAFRSRVCTEAVVVIHWYHG